MKSRLTFFAVVLLSCTSYAQEAVTNAAKTTYNSNNSGEELKEESASDSTTVLETEQAKDKSHKFVEKKEQKNAGIISSSEEDTTIPTVQSSSALFKANTDSYKSVQYQSSHNPSSRSASSYQQSEMDNNLEIMNAISPDAFETNLYNYVNGHYDAANGTSLLRAAEQNPTNTELRQQLSAYYFIDGNVEKADSITVQMVTDGTICAGQLTYAWNLTNSVQAGNTLIVHGFTDFLPLIHEMDSASFEYDLVSLDMLQSLDYQTRLAEKGYIIPETSVIDTAFLLQFVKANSNRNIQLSMTLPKEYLQTFLPDLYPVGLTFAVAKKPEDEELNTRLWQETWDRSVLMNGTKDWGDAWSKNYLPSLFVLKKIYENRGDTEEVKKINDVIIAISARTNMNSKVKKYTAE